MTRYITTRPCPQCGAVTSVPVAEVSTHAGRTVARCRGCNALVRVEPVRAKFNPRATCNESCLTSLSRVCDCSCGGRNHGTAYS